MKKREYLPISANTLFHFTKNINNLISILKNGFYPRYSLEDFSLIAKDIIQNDSKIQDDFKDQALPMICFCDIPLTKIKIHVDNYGGYGIGLSKKWGEKNGLNPIKYINSESDLSKHYREFATHARSLYDYRDNKIMGIFFRLFSYVKPYEGILFKNKKKITFYDEREWRFIPKITAEDENNNIAKKVIGKEDYDNKNMLREHNKRLKKNFPLHFKEDDINYILVRNKSQLLKIIATIKKMKSFSSEEKDLLLTKVISIDQIFEDF